MAMTDAKATVVGLGSNASFPHPPCEVCGDTFEFGTPDALDYCRRNHYAGYSAYLQSDEADDEMSENDDSQSAAVPSPQRDRKSVV